MVNINLEKYKKLLVQIAVKKGYQVRSHKVGTRMRVWESHVSYDGRCSCTESCSSIGPHVLVLYRDKLEEITVLAHEVGHIKTICRQDSTVRLEFNASTWAIRFFRINNLKNNCLDSIIKDYRECYKSYLDQYGFKMLSENDLV